MFEKDYFVDSKISNYKDYRTKIFEHQATDVIELLNLQVDDSILDYGCATGGLLKALKDKGFNKLRGTDISRWAIDYGRDVFDLNMELHYYLPELLQSKTDYIFMFDVLEHLPNKELETILKYTKQGLEKELLVRIPVSLNEGDNFFYDVSMNDKTHIQIHCANWWIELLSKFGLQFINLIEIESIYNSDGVFCGIFKEKQIGI